MDSQQPLQKSNRIPYFDYLRVFATFAVILLHTAAQNWRVPDVHTFEWQTLNIYDSFAFWGVPVFLMISGALFLQREKLNIKKLYSKNISRLAVAYFFWSFVYAIIDPFLNGFPFLIKSVPVDTIISHFHLWFVPVIIGLYICLPIIRKIVESKEVARFFLILSFIFAFVFGELKTIVNDFTGGLIKEFADSVFSLISSMRMDLVLGFAFYFILGYVLYRTDISVKQQKIIYALGFLSIILTIVLNILASFRKDVSTNAYGDNFTLSAAFVSSAIFVWFKYHIKGTGKLDGIIIKLSKYSFGVYLVHMAVMNFFVKIGFHSLTFNPIIAIPAVFASVTVISFIISAILNKIPFLKNWIV